MERSNKMALCRRPKKDQNIAAANQVEPREGRVGEKVLTREDDQVSNRLNHLIAILGAREKTRLPFGRQFGYYALRVSSGAGDSNCTFTEIGAEDLERD